jgi:hypothetical protein
MDKSRIAKWLRQSDTDAKATPTQPFLENSDFVLENPGVTMEWKTEASLDPVITMSLHQPCEVPRMQIRVTVPRELTT